MDAIEYLSLVQGQIFIFNQIALLLDQALLQRGAIYQTLDKHFPIGQVIVIEHVVYVGDDLIIHPVTVSLDLVKHLLHTLVHFLGFEVEQPVTVGVIWGNISIKITDPWWLHMSQLINGSLSICS